MWSVSADPLKFEEAIQWFRNRVPVTDTEFKDLSEAARRRAFMVGGLAQLDLVNEVQSALERAVSEGSDFADFRKEVGEKLQNAWGDSVKNPAWRLENIYRTNVQSAYAAGRWKQQTDPDVIKARPFWMYDSVLDSRTSSICRNLNGTLRPADDPFWNTRYPPNHFGGCRSGVRSFTRKGMERRGVTETPPTTEPDVAFRQVPSLDDWEPDLSKYPEALRKRYLERVQNLPRRKASRGVHYRTLTSDLSDEDVTQVLEAVDDAGLLGFLERRPLNSLEIVREFGTGNSHTDSSLGLTWPPGTVGYSRIQIRALDEVPEGLEQLTPGQSFTVDLVKSGVDAMKGTLVHELGHHIIFEGERALEMKSAGRFPRAIQSAYTLQRAGRSISARRW